MWMVKDVGARLKIPQGEGSEESAGEIQLQRAVGPGVRAVGPWCSTTRTPLDVVPPFWPRRSQQGLGEAEQVRESSERARVWVCLETSSGRPSGPQKAVFLPVLCGEGMEGRC